MRTYNLRSTDQATTVHVATNENLAVRDAPGANEVESVSVGATAVLGWVFTTAAGEPGLLPWPTAELGAQLDVSAAGVDLVFGALNQGLVLGHFARVNTGLTLDVETHAQEQAALSGAGLKWCSYTGAWTSILAAATDRLELAITVNRPTGMGTQTLSLRMSADAYLRGAWPGGNGIQPNGAQTESVEVARTTQTGDVERVAATQQSDVEIV